MKLRYKYRIYPDSEQKQILHQVIGNQRWIWNYFLNKEIEYHKEMGKFNFYFENSRCLKDLKKEHEWLKIGPSQGLQTTVRHLDEAMRRCFKKTSGFPKFKKKKEFEGSIEIPLAAAPWKWNKKQIYIPKVGWIKWKLHRRIPSKFVTVAVILDGDQWFMSLIVDVEEQETKSLSHINQAVGLDLNSNEIVVTSDGECFKNPKFFNRSKSRLKKIQRQFSRTKKGSNRRKRKQLQIRKCFKKITNQRKDFLHKISYQIVNDYDFIGTEDLNVKGMQRWNGSMIQDAGFSTLLHMLEYKSRLYGKTFQKIDRFAPSSKACNACGNINKYLMLRQRTYECQECGHIEDRDLNAARNIRDWSIFDYNTVANTEIYGRGDTSAGDLSKDISKYVSLNRQKFLNKNQGAETTRS